MTATVGPGASPAASRTGRARPWTTSIGTDTASARQPRLSAAPADGRTARRQRRRPRRSPPPSGTPSARPPTGRPTRNGATAAQPLRRTAIRRHRAAEPAPASGAPRCGPGLARRRATTHAHLVGRVGGADQIGRGRRRRPRRLDSTTSRPSPARRRHRRWTRAGPCGVSSSITRSSPPAARRPSRPGGPAGSPRARPRSPPGSNTAISVPIGNVSTKPSSASGRETTTANTIPRTSPGPRRSAP